MANTHSTGDTALKPSAVKPKLPDMFKVLLLNDDYTPMEFVVETIERFFNKSREQATQIMLKYIQKVLACVGFIRKTSRKPR